jgi:hypothetical protein
MASLNESNRSNFDHKRSTSYYLILIFAVIGLIFLGLIILFFRLVYSPNPGQIELKTIASTSTTVEKFSSTTPNTPNKEISTTTTLLDLSNCNTLSPLKKDGCYIYVATSNIDFSICDQILSSFSKSQCYTQVINSIQDLKDPNACEKILNSTLQDACYDSVMGLNAGITRTPEEICGKLKSPVNHEECILRVTAILPETQSGTVSSSITCGMIDNSEQRDRCFYKNNAPCDILESPNYKNQCLYTLEEKREYKDSTICEEMNNDMNQTIRSVLLSSDGLILNLKLPTKDGCFLALGICDRIQDTKIKDLCYVKNNLCGKVKAANLKEYCFAVYHTSCEKIQDYGVQRYCLGSPGAGLPSLPIEMSAQVL